MRDRTTSWKKILAAHEEGEEGQITRIHRIDGTGMSDSDGLGKIERWAEEVVRAPRVSLASHPVCDGAH
jgi:hypothetical protein